MSPSVLGAAPTGRTGHPPVRTRPDLGPAAVPFPGATAIDDHCRPGRAGVPGSPEADRRCQNQPMRPLIPYAILGLLTLVAGLGLGLGLAFAP